MFFYSQANSRKYSKRLLSLLLFFCLCYNVAFAASPTLGTVSPSTGSTAPDLARTFTARYYDTDGWQNLKEAYLLISTSSTALTNAAYVYYNQNTNLLYVRNDANTAWLGGYAPGSANVIENSYVKLNCSATTFTGSTSTLTVNFNFTFKTSYSGKAYKVYTKAVDDTVLTVNWTQKGTYSVNNPPIVGTVTPASGAIATNTAQTFTTTYTDPDSWQNIQYVYFLINTSTAGTNCLYAYYNQNTNKLYLRNDANTSWLGGYAPGSANTIENTYVKLDCSKTTIYPSDSSLTLFIDWNITFKPVFSGLKNAYLYVRDDANAYQNWVQKGTLTIQGDAIPPTGSIIINNSSQYTNTTLVTLTLLATDSDSGMGTGAQMQFSNDNITWPTPEAYATTKAWALTAGNGAKTVYVKFKDVAGNWSTPVSVNITLDAIAPNILVNSVNTPTNQNVTLSYCVSDNFTASSEITLTGDNSPYINEGAYNVALTAKDKANNTSTATLSFSIDKTAPIVIITSPSNGALLEDANIQLQGTVDGVAFSESRTLVEGDNVLTKTATDAAGNTTSTSVSVYLYLGKLIGPEGGEATSQDAKVKLVIPPGALSSPTQIKILSVNQETLQGAAPQGTSLLSVVECKPYGLVFNQPVSLIYTLSHPEIPGTPVSLGLYDAIQNQIYYTGDPSIVPEDGYTLNFSILHFSTYAALKNLVSQGAPIGGGVKIPLPDMFTGSFSTGIPMTVSPGRKGLQPSIALNYRSSNPNSWVGVGYSLNSGYIVRSTKLGPPSYNDIQDTFYLITDSGTTEFVHLVDNLYQAKIESAFSKFYKEADDSWKVVSKDGATLRFGQSSDSKETSSLGTFSWHLTRAQDTNGNYIDYSYTKDQGKSYLSHIDYTGNTIGVAPTNTVEFILESRNDIASSYISTSKIATARRLKEIQVKVNSDLVWRYSLEYIYSPDTNRSLLKSVIQYGADGKSLPVQNFTYQRAK